MSFGLPLALLTLVALPALGGLYWLAQRRRAAYAVRFTNLSLLAQVAPRGPGIRRHVPATLFLLALGTLLLSFARPSLSIAVPGEHTNMMLVIDVSGSMQATDIQPTRLAAAQNSAHSLIDSLPSNASVGLISFSTEATLLAPLSQDHSAAVNALGMLHARGATATGDALQLAIDQIVQSPGFSGAHPTPSMIVLLTDGGWNYGSSPDDAAARAATLGIKITTVGIGSRSGTPVMVLGQDVGGVDELDLQNIATTTGGKYFFVSDAGRLQQIYSTLGSQFGWRHQQVDLTVPLEIGAVVVLVGAATLSLLWFRLLP